MAIKRYPLTAGAKPKALDSLLVDGQVYPLTMNNGLFGYWRQGDSDNERDRTFQVVVKTDLLKHPVNRGGATTWFIRPKGRERVRLDPSKETAE